MMCILKRGRGRGIAKVRVKQRSWVTHSLPSQPMDLVLTPITLRMIVLHMRLVSWNANPRRDRRFLMSVIHASNVSVQGVVVPHSSSTKMSVSTFWRARSNPVRNASSKRADSAWPKKAMAISTNLKAKHQSSKNVQSSLIKFELCVKRTTYGFWHFCIRAFTRSASAPNEKRKETGII